jgi:hypothetical protein
MGPAVICGASSRGERTAWLAELWRTAWADAGALEELLTDDQGLDAARFLDTGAGPLDHEGARDPPRATPGQCLPLDGPRPAR